MASFNDGKAAIIAKWNKDWTLKTLVPTALLFIASLIFHIPVLAYFFFILAFTVFDILGFGNVVTITALNKSEDVDATMSYRIIQMMMQFTLLSFAFLIGGWTCVLACAIAHWFTLCDKLFYILQKIGDQGSYPWLEGWSVFFVLKLAGNKSVTTPEFNTMSLVGFLLGLAIVLFL